MTQTLNFLVNHLALIVALGLSLALGMIAWIILSILAAPTYLGLWWLEESLYSKAKQTRLRFRIAKKGLPNYFMSLAATLVTLSSAELLRWVYQNHEYLRSALLFDSNFPTDAARLCVAGVVAIYIISYFCADPYGRGPWERFQQTDLPAPFRKLRDQLDKFAQLSDAALLAEDKKLRAWVELGMPAGHRTAFDAAVADLRRRRPAKWKLPDLYQMAVAIKMAPHVKGSYDVAFRELSPHAHADFEGTMAALRHQVIATLSAPHLGQPDVRCS